jgi:pimeloyl-ACP methyl ester carboxylesterase
MSDATRLGVGSSVVQPRDEVVERHVQPEIGPMIAWAIHRAIPGSALAIFEKSGHLPFCEESEGFVSRVEAFLAQPLRNPASR